MNSLEDGIDTPGPDWVTTWALALTRACSWRLEAVAERGTSGLVFQTVNVNSLLDLSGLRKEGQRLHTDPVHLCRTVKNFDNPPFPIHRLPHNRVRTAVQ